ncbi:Protein O-linked-mannose beta-1,4-N-acetylglucosaminyltransferase 2, partial [Ananas comosus]
STNAEEENTKSKLEIGVELESHVDVVERNQEAHDIVGDWKARREKKRTSFIMRGASKEQYMCDFSQRRSDTCVVEGDVRVLVPKCVVNHDVPAIIFSTGGFLGNFFHDFTDVLIPLFITSRQYNGDVRFLVTNFNSRWIKKYQPLLLRSPVSNYHLDREKSTHCFPKAHVGLISHKELSINSSISPNGYSMTEFRELLRTCYSLSRNSVSKGTRRPRLLIVFRKGSRTFMNKKEVILMARGLGYKVVLAGPEETHNLPRFARIVNSCDVMMGVHGAGLANMMFLPDNATLIQIVPWGGLGYACRHDFGNPAPDMGLRYLEYEIREEESSLIYQYPRDHPVFSDPLSIHKQGWNALWSIFLNQQNIKLDVRRFRGVLQEALKSLR